MEIRKLYRYEREKGKITVSPIKPECEYTELYRVIADEGKVVTLDGEETFDVIDTEVKDGWYEVDAPERDILEITE